MRLLPLELLASGDLLPVANLVLSWPPKMTSSSSMSWENIPKERFFPLLWMVGRSELPNRESIAGVSAAAGGKLVDHLKFLLPQTFDGAFVLRLGFGGLLLLTVVQSELLLESRADSVDGVRTGVSDSPDGQTMGLSSQE